VNGDKIMEAIGMIDDEIIAEAKKPEKKRFGAKKVLALVAAILILVVLSVTAVALGLFDNKIKDINITHEFFDENESIDSYILDFNIEIPKDAEETIKEYYIPMILVDDEYNASANSYSGYFYWENTEGKQILAFNQYSTLTFDSYRTSFAGKIKVTKEKFIFGGEEIQCIIFTKEEEDNNSIKTLYWSDGYNIFKITAYNCDDEFITKVINSLEIVKDFSDYGKFRENGYN